MWALPGSSRESILSPVKASMMLPPRFSGDSMKIQMHGSQEKEEDSREENLNNEKEERKVAKADPEETSKVIQKEKERDHKKENQKDTTEMMDIGMMMTPKQRTGPKAVKEKESPRENQRTKESSKEKMKRKEKEKVKPIQLNPLPILHNLRPPMGQTPLTGETTTVTGTKDGLQIHGPHNHGRMTATTPITAMPTMEGGMTPQRTVCPSRSLPERLFQKHISLNVPPRIGMISMAPQRSTHT